MQQNNVLTSNNDHVINNNVVNIYIVYKLDPIASIRETTFTIQNALFGAMQITKNADTNKYHYKGYGICFDESEQFSHTITEGGRGHTTLARNVIIFGADMSFSKHANNKRNNIYVMGKDYVQRINDTTIYAEKMYYRNFTYLGKKFMLGLHYNGDDSYFFVNARQELKFKAKTDQLVKEKLCIGNLRDQWTTSEPEKTVVYGKIYDFVVDYEQIAGTTKIIDMHNYLITKHNISLSIYKMWLINLAISLFSIIKTKALECVSVTNQECMSRPKILDVNEDVGEALFYPYNVLLNKCRGSCDTLDDPMAR